MMERGSRDGVPRRRQIAVHVLYWGAVLVVSLVLVYGLLLFLESRDGSTIEPDGPAGASVPAMRSHSAQAPSTGSTPASLANTTMRFAALYSGWHAVSTSRS